MNPVPEGFPISFEYGQVPQPEQLVSDLAWYPLVLQFAPSRHWAVLKKLLIRDSAITPSHPPCPHTWLPPSRSATAEIFSREGLPTPSPNPNLPKEDDTLGTLLRNMFRKPGVTPPLNMIAGNTETQSLYQANQRDTISPMHCDLRFAKHLAS